MWLAGAATNAAMPGATASAGDLLFGRRLDATAGRSGVGPAVGTAGLRRWTLARRSGDHTGPGHAPFDATVAATAACSTPTGQLCLAQSVAGPADASAAAAAIACSGLASSPAGAASVAWWG